jgi:hypothetical protein
LRPQVFISHSGKDKERFVRGLAKALQEKGIRVWFDEWALLPGDSLVEKLYGEGIGEADAMITVLSLNSNESKWVKDEINTGKVNSIERGMKLIPVIIDDCEVPACLKSTVFEKIKDVNDYGASLSRIVAAIYNIRDKKSLGSAPKYVDAYIMDVGDLNRIDNIALRLACEKAIEQGHEHVAVENLEREFAELEIGRDQYNESLEILDHRSYIRAWKVNSPYIPDLSITRYGFEEYLRSYVENYETILRDVIFEIVNGNWRSDEVATKLNVPLMITNHIFNLLGDRDLAKLSKVLCPYEDIYEISPELKRMLGTLQ